MNTGSTLINVSTTNESGIDWAWSPVEKNYGVFVFTLLCIETACLMIIQLNVVLRVTGFQHIPTSNI